MNKVRKNPIATNDGEKDSCISVAYVCNKVYFPITYISIITFLKNCSEKNVYNLVICYTDVESYNIKNVKAICKEHKNIRLNFVDINKWWEKLKKDSKIPNINYCCYFLPWILSNYNKILYLDSDTIVNSDLMELYNIDLKGSVILAAKKKNKLSDGRNTYHQLYDQGVLVMDLFKLRGLIDIDKICNINKQNTSQCYWRLFSDFGKITEMNHYWDYCNQSFTEKDEDYYQTFDKAHIIHFCGNPKPWISPESPFAEFWWQNARGTFCYEELIRHMCMKEEKRSLFFKIVDLLLPKNTKRREIVKLLFARSK